MNDRTGYIEETAYNAAVNILATEYLVKKENYTEYAKYINALYELTSIKKREKAETLNVIFWLNVHSRNLGEMITQGDYEYLKERLIELLDDEIERKGN